MNWQFSNDAPIYAQLVGQIRAGIVSGAFSPGRASPFCESCAVKIVKNPFVHKFFSIGLLHFRKNALK